MGVVDVFKQVLKETAGDVLSGVGSTVEGLKKSVEERGGDAMSKAVDAFVMRCP